MIYYISDMHFFHNRIMTLSKRPFMDVEEMHETIIRNWNRVVSCWDKVYILGDVGFYHRHEIVEILNRLHGHKYLVIGNHDTENLRHKSYRDCFEGVYPYTEIYDKDRKVVLFHYPIEEWNGFYRERYHLHGHVHGQDQELKKLPRRYNVSVERIDYTPRTLDELIAMNEEEVLEK